MKHILLLLIRLYQRTISPLLVSIFGHSCRFHPTCSEYMYHAVAKHGIIMGFSQGVRRIVRCHPWSSGGYDPV